jgi:hypothetical protein
MLVIHQKSNTAVSQVFGNPRTVESHNRLRHMPSNEPWALWDEYTRLQKAARWKTGAKSLIHLRSIAIEK